MGDFATGLYAGTMHVSSRLPARYEPNALTKALAERQDRGLECLDLTASNPLSTGLHFPEDLLRRALAGAAVAGTSRTPGAARRPARRSPPGTAMG